MGKEIASTADLHLKLRSHADVPEVVGAAYALDGLILLEADLGPEFFRLRSGLLGEVGQKLVNHRIPTGVVLANATAYGERFRELVREHTAHPHLRFFTTEAEAREWLTSLP